MSLFFSYMLSAFPGRPDLKFLTALHAFTSHPKCRQRVGDESGKSHIPFQWFDPWGSHCSEPARRVQDHDVLPNDIVVLLLCNNANTAGLGEVTRLARATFHLFPKRMQKTQAINRKLTSLTAPVVSLRDWWSSTNQ